MSIGSETTFGRGKKKISLPCHEFRRKNKSVDTISRFMPHVFFLPKDFPFRIQPSAYKFKPAITKKDTQKFTRKTLILHTAATVITNKKLITDQHHKPVSKNITPASSIHRKQPRKHRSLSSSDTHTCRKQNQTPDLFPYTLSKHSEIKSEPDPVKKKNHQKVVFLKLLDLGCLVSFSIILGMNLE